MAGLDFKKLGTATVADSEISPRRIFRALPNKEAKYNYARDVQAEVWDEWLERRPEPDLVVKMNTGGGKTVVGLLMLKSGLNEGVGPSVYVTPNIHLAQQVREEAEQLGLKTVDDPNSGQFRGGRAILVTHIHRLFNGQSVFGVEGSAKPPIQLGTVLIDDAHACLTTVQQQFTMSIPSAHQAYKDLLAFFGEDLKRQSPSQFLGIAEGDSASVLRVPYWAWRAGQAKVTEVLGEHRLEDVLKFAWPLVAEDLPFSDAVFTSAGLEIRPASLPIERIPSFAQAKRRLYLTATLADDNILISHFGADPSSVTRSITPDSADDLGERLLLMPQETHPSVSLTAIQTMLAEKAKKYNVVVIVPSNRRAEFWAEAASAVLTKDNIEEGIGALREGHVGLVVMVNRYDGIDLPGNACRVLVLDGVPEAYGGLDRMEALALEDSEAMINRQIQRIEQGMGRGVRSKDDHCVVILLDHRLTQRLHGAANLARFSPATRAQIEISQQLSFQLEELPFGAVSEAMDKCLDRDAEWVEVSIAALNGVEYDAAVEADPIAVAQRAAFVSARSGQFQEADAALSAVVESVQDGRSKGFVKQQIAMFRDFTNPVAAQAMQKSALGDNKYLLKPLGGISVNRLKPNETQAKSSAEFLTAKYETGNELIVGVEALLSDLVPDPDPMAVKKFERATKHLAQHLGFVGQLPEEELGEGPDALWALGNLDFLVIECKSGSTTAQIHKRDMAQLSHSVDWFVTAYDNSCKPTPVMIHNSRELASDTAAREGTRIMQFADLANFRQAVREWTMALATGKSFDDPSSVTQQLIAHGLNGSVILQRFTKSPKAN